MPLVQEIELVSNALQSEGDQFEQAFIDLVKEFRIAEIEPLLEENTQLINEDYGKYHFLAILKAIFLEYEKYGDTRIMVQRGFCSKQCYGNQDNVYQFKGNQSGKTIAFVIDNQGELKTFHPCSDFVDRAGNQAEDYWDLMHVVIKKIIDLQ